MSYYTWWEFGLFSGDDDKRTTFILYRRRGRLKEEREWGCNESAQMFVTPEYWQNLRS